MQITSSPLVLMVTATVEFYVGDGDAEKLSDHSQKCSLIM